MRWPWRRFEAFFERHQARKAKEGLERQRDLLIAAVNANSNYDGDQAREGKLERLRELEDSTARAIEFIYANVGSKGEVPKEEDPFETDPLFGPLRRRRLDQVNSEVAQAIQQHAQMLNQTVGPPQMEEAGLGRNLLDSMVST